MPDHILIVDDEDILCRLTVRMLADEGFVAIALQSPRAALDLLAGETQANLLIADVLMPDMKGDRFVRLARELRPTLPVLLISGFPAPEETDPRALQAYAFLSNPSTRSSSAAPCGCCSYREHPRAKTPLVYTADAPNSPRATTQTTSAPADTESFRRPRAGLLHRGHARGHHQCAGNRLAP
jgi:CheY-like chemotaxis protein